MDMSKKIHQTIISWKTANNKQTKSQKLKNSQQTSQKTLTREGEGGESFLLHIGIELVGENKGMQPAIILVATLYAA